MAIPIAIAVLLAPAIGQCAQPGGLDVGLPVSGHAEAIAGVAMRGTPSRPDPDANDPDPVALRARALTDQATRLEHSEGVRRDLAQAHDLYCAAARMHYVDALLRLGWMYANGRGVIRSDSTANALFRRAAALGSDLGARLADTIKGADSGLPACMSPSTVVALPDPSDVRETNSTTADSAATPRVDLPAQFRMAPATQEYRRFVVQVLELSREFRLDPRLVFSLIRVESNLDPMARSARNAQGLMQLVPETAERFAVKDVWNPIENLRGGMTYLRWLLSYFRGDVVLALAAYNAGEGTVDKYRGVPPFPETMAYVQRIRALYPFDRHAYDPRASAGFGVSPAITGDSARSRAAVGLPRANRNSGGPAG